MAKKRGARKPITIENLIAALSMSEMYLRGVRLSLEGMKPRSLVPSPADSEAESDTAIDCGVVAGLPLAIRPICIPAAGSNCWPTIRWHRKGDPARTRREGIAAEGVRRGKAKPRRSSVGNRRRSRK